MTIAILIKLLDIKMVAKSFLGCSKSLATKIELAFFELTALSISTFVKEKKAISDADIKPEKNKSTKIPKIYARAFQLKTSRGKRSKFDGSESKLIYFDYLKRQIVIRINIWDIV